MRASAKMKIDQPSVTPAARGLELFFPLPGLVATRASYEH
jgi:hypothetical protein